MSNDSSIAQALVEATYTLRRAGVGDARRDAATLLANLIGRDTTYLIAHAEELLTASDVARYRVYIERRANGEPIQYIVGHQEFFNLDFIVTPDVLIPRPETELLVEKALELIAKDAEQRICDVGTGSGCIAISILHERPKTTAMGLDNSLEALGVAARNAARHDVSNRIDLMESDGFRVLNNSGFEFDLIVSNPPYVVEEVFDSLQREVREHEPRGALTPGSDGLSMIRRLLTDSPNYLLPGGHLLIEIGYDQSAAVRELIDPTVWQLVDIYKDLQGIERTVAVKRL